MSSRSHSRPRRRSARFSQLVAGFSRARSVDRCLEFQRGRRRLFVEALEDRRLLAVDLLGSPSWLGLGSGVMFGGVSAADPNNVSSGGVEGVAVDPANPAHILIGTINGGIWRTTNGNRPFNGVDDDGANGVDDPLEQPTWTPLTDQFASLAIGDIAFDPLDATGNTLFAGTGSASSLSSAGGTPIGVMRTTDGGNSWTVFPITAGPGEPPVRSILPTTFDANPGAAGVQQVVMVGTTTGFFRSVDGGQNYTAIGAAQGLNAGAVTSIIADPNNASQFFVGVVGQGVFRSVDGGANWTPVLNGLANQLTSTSIKVVAHPGGGTTVLHTLISGPTVGAFTSNDSGANWTPLAALPAGFLNATFNNLYTTRAADQLTVDPTNAQIIYVAKGYGGNPHIMRYDPAGAGNWVQIQGAGGAGGNTTPHVDHRDLDFVGTNILVNANDGGIYFIRNPQNAAANRWTSLHGRGATAISATEYTNVAWDSTFNVATGGAQDNGTGVANGTGDLNWTLYNFADGGDVQVDTVNAGAGRVFRYASVQNFSFFGGSTALGRFTFDTATNQPVAAVELMPAGGLANFNGPFTPLYELNNVNRARLVTGDTTGTPGTSPVYELLNAATAPNAAGATWQAVPVGAGFGGVSGSAIAYGGRLGGVDNPEVLVVGATGGVFVRSTAGGTLTVTPTAFPGGTIQDVVLDPQNWQHFFVADGSNVFETPDAGTTWNNITRNLALVNFALQSLEFIPTTNGGAVVVGGNLGVSKLLLDSPTAQWTRFGVGLPNAVVFDLDYDPVDDLLLGGTFGRGAWQVANAATVVDDAGVLNICGDEDFVNQDDVFRLIRNAMNPLVLDVFVNSIAPVFSVAIAALSQINVFGIGGNDTLIVDSTNGLINVPNGIRYDGDGACPDEPLGFGYDRGIDTLQLLQTGGATHTSDTVGVGATVGSGRSTIVGAGVGNVQTIFFEELEPVLDVVPAATFFVQAVPGVASLLQAANTINYEVGQALGATAGRITVDAFEPVEFMNKTNLVIDAGAGQDDVFLNNSLLPTLLSTILVNGGDGNDTIAAVNLNASLTTVTLSGGAGVDVLDATALTQTAPLTLNGGEGDDVLVGGPGIDTYSGDAGDDILVASAGNDTLGGGFGVDQINIIGRSLPDVITANQSAAGTLAVTFNGNARTYTLLTDERVFIDGGLGDDIIAINVVDAVAPASSLPFEVVGNSPNASDRLIVNDDGFGNLVVHHEGPDGRSGSIVVGAFAPVDYHAIERVDVTPLNAAGGTGTDGLGRLIVFEHDDSESNDSRATATPLGVEPVFLGQRNIDPGGIALPPPFPGVPGDADWFKFRPGKIGTFRVEALFQEINTLANGRPGLPGGGDLSLEVYRANGTLIVASASADDDESVDVSMAANTDYFIRVFGAAADAINVYDLNVKEVDILGPQVFDPDGAGPITPVFPNNQNTFDLFDPKPRTSGPTPPITSITINLRDPLDFNLLLRAPGDVYPALNVLDAATMRPASSPEHYQVRGDRVGLVAITAINVVNNPVAAGQLATATVQLVFAAPLPDDRYTLTIFDSLTDPAGNALDGGTNADEPQENPTFPSGDGISGGDFAARFTVDARPEIASVIPQQITVDINGNFVWDPAAGQGGDATNVDLTFTMQVRNAAGVTLGGFGVHDLVFAGRFFIPDPNGLPAANRFDQLAVYGNSQELAAQRWLIDLNSDGVVNTALGEILTLQPAGGLPGNFNVVGAIPVAGNFDGNAANGDEIGLYNAGRWALDSNRNFVIDAADTFITNTLLGHPIVGNFDGDALDDLAVFNSNVFSFNLANDGLTDAADATLTWGFPGTLDRPIAADIDRDGIDDIGLWVPRDNAQIPTALAEWYFLLSNNFIAPGVPGAPTTGTIARLNHPFTPAPFGFDLYAEFGNETALPLVGNFDPPVGAPVDPHTNPSADFDGDNDVDGADFLTWQRGLGQPNAAASAGDANGDGQVNSVDAGIWRQQFGETPAEAAASVAGGSVALASASSSAPSSAASAPAASASAADPRGDFNQLYVVTTSSTARARAARREAAADAAFAGDDSPWRRHRPDEYRPATGGFGSAGARRRGSLRGDWELPEAPAAAREDESTLNVEEWDEAVLAAI